MVGSKKHELKEAGDKKRVKRRRNYDDHDKEVSAEDSKAKTNKKKDGTSNNDSDDSESEDDEKLDLMLNKEDEDEDDLAEIDSSNIITGGRRTRGKVIDYKKTAEALDKESGRSVLSGDSESEMAAKEQTGEEEDAEDADFPEPEKQ
ncbi:LAME_0H19658g1_1 [Lachancea meyersii CBS 8951]|uniref:Histone H2A.Z-specific chaperone CHZ1 n=1 Tax=Lachancea meyersii CBS 8951 TaxID=1266667 RepID=A0A1G4KJ54_9SACH|nr:LAME_0H19658g1_1 [Lachancea meyersii CBS 8951]